MPAKKEGGATPWPVHSRRGAAQAKPGARGSETAVARRNRMAMRSAACSDRSGPGSGGWRRLEWHGLSSRRAEGTKCGRPCCRQHGGESRAVPMARSARGLFSLGPGERGGWVLQGLERLCFSRRVVPLDIKFCSITPRPGVGASPAIDRQGKRAGWRARNGPKRAHRQPAEAASNVRACESTRRAGTQGRRVRRGGEGCRRGRPTRGGTCRGGSWPAR